MVPATTAQTLNLPTDGVSDSAAPANSQIAALAAKGYGLAYVRSSNNPYICFSDLQIPAGFWLSGGGRLYGKYTGATPGTVPTNGTWNGTAFVPAPGNAGAFSRATAQLAQNAGIFNCSVFGQAHDGSQSPYALVATNKGTLTHHCLIAGGAGGAFHGDAGSQGGKLYNTYVTNGYNTPAYVTPTFTSGAGTVNIVVSAGAGIVVGSSVHSLSRPTSVVSGTYVTAVAGTAVTLSTAIGGTATAGDVLLFITNGCGGIFDSDWEISNVETFHGPWEVGAGDDQYDNCHFSDGGGSALHNVIIDIGSQGSSDFTSCTFDSATQVAGHVLRIRGGIKEKGPRIQVGLNSGSAWPHIQDVCADTSSGSMVQSATVPNLTSVGLTAMVLYSGTVNSVSNGKAAAANPLDSVVGTDAATTSFSAGFALGSGATFNGYARDNRYAGVMQPPSIPSLSGVVQLSASTGALTAGSANEITGMSTPSLPVGVYNVSVNVDLSGPTSTGHIDVYLAPASVGGATVSSVVQGTTLRFTTGVDAPAVFGAVVTITAAGALSPYVFPVAGMTGTVIVNAGNQAGATAFKVSQVSWAAVA